MNIKECFEKFGGDYEGAAARLGKEERVTRHTKTFAEGDDLQLIRASLEANDREAAFRHIHNVKGVALNLGLTQLFEKSDVLCEVLRPGKPPVGDEELKEMFAELKTVYDNFRNVMAEIE